MVRAFVAIPIPPDMAENIAAVQQKLRTNLQGIRWVRTENLHLTLKFLGPIPENKIAPVTESLHQTLSVISIFWIEGRGIGVFPDIKRPRVLWAGLVATELRVLAEKVESALEGLGFPREKRSFSPHLTLGRWRSFDGSSELLQRELQRWENYDFGKCLADSVVLFQSVLKPDGAVYSPLSTIPLGGSHQPN